MSQRFDSLYTRDKDGGSLKPGKFSELVLDYAAPLLDEGDPPSIDALRRAMQIATLCWNVAALEMRGDPSVRQTLDPLMTHAPAKLRSVVQRLLEDRKKRFVAIPVLLDVDVTGTDLTTARVVARAYTPPARAGTGPAAPSTAQPSTPGGRTQRVPSPAGRHAASRYGLLRGGRA